MPWLEWYNSLAKPSWTPAPATIGLIWQILYPVVILTFGFVFVQAVRRKVPWLVALPFAINLVANLIFRADDGVVVTVLHLSITATNWGKA